MLHQFVQSYNILTVIFHFSHLSICFPTWYQQSNGGRRKEMPRLHTIKKLFVREFDVLRPNKSQKQASSTNPSFWRSALWWGEGEIPWFSLQIWGIWSCLCCSFGCADVISHSRGTFPLQPQESSVPSPCNLQTGLFLPSSPKCLSIMQHVVNLNRCLKMFAQGALDLLVQRQQHEGRVGVKTVERPQTDLYFNEH